MAISKSKGGQYSTVNIFNGKERWTETERQRQRERDWERQRDRDLQLRGKKINKIMGQENEERDKMARESSDLGRNMLG